MRTGKSGPGQVLDQIETKAPFWMKKQKETHWSELGRMCSFVPGQKVYGMKPLTERGNNGRVRSRFCEERDAGQQGWGERERRRLHKQVRDNRESRTSRYDALSREGNCPPDGREGEWLVSESLRRLRNLLS